MSSEFFLSYFIPGSYSFEVQNICQGQYGIDINAECRINFFPNDTVESYGTVKRAKFQGNPDIAGIGVVIGFITGTLLCLLSLFFLVREMAMRWKWVPILSKRYRPLPNPSPRGTRQKRWKRAFGDFNITAERSRFIQWLFNFLSNLLIANADTQIFISLAYGINFALASKCTLSAYHYKVGLNMVLLALASTNLSTLMIRDYWRRAKLAASMRFLVVAFIYVVLIWMLVYQFMGASRPEDTWSFLTKQRGGLATDSSILLPMSCFLDPDLDPLRRLTDAQLNRVGGVLGTKAATLEVIVGSAMLVCFLLSHLAHGIRWCRGHSRPKANRPVWWGVIVSLYWIVALGASTVAYVACYLIVWCLRGWVYESGWMEDNGNSERDAVSSTLYNLIFRKNYSMLASVFVAGFAWEIGFNRGMDRLWDSWNQGRQWKDIRHKYVEGGEDEE
ncbi:hypothetical protein SAPIO_CDS3057 [Scedosporium apiospermum]|uniref:Complex III subunit 9 n=1 Tax=Pseudallescheria apiosperma TaxID=563466 RepID=A0A084G9X6_PSEDA|nr:uncharacterized protein SAPIO_CDS3057 [Scedosporium apiospermum]KEZ44138.1 hypothetical protein SAPIO_CDS3057 [Scedosporium apiospermum]